MEEYRAIVDFSNYEVSNHGNVRNKTTGRILKGFPDGKGYLMVDLIKNKYRCSHKIHRLVALNFIDNPENKLEVDHINNNKNQNSVSNLRWCTKFENMRNLKKSTKNTSGIKGVSWRKIVKKWCAYIQIDGIKTSLGYFSNIEDAKLARMKKANELFGEFVNDCEKLPKIKLKSTVKLFTQIDELLNEINHLKHL